MVVVSVALSVRAADLRHILSVTSGQHTAEQGRHDSINGETRLGVPALLSSTHHVLLSVFAVSGTLCKAV